MTQEPGLRERKKERTRRHVSETARRLFAERGFEAVTVAEVAAAADVSQATVFNYFPNKEDLFYGGLEAFEESLLDAIGDRPPGESALAAFGRFVTEPRGLLAAKDPDAAERMAAMARVIEESPALLARERHILAGYTDSLAALLREETGAKPDDVQPWVAANAMMGVHRALIGFSRRQVLAGVRNPQLRRRILAEARAALGSLEHGLGAYAVRSGSVARLRSRRP
jgi:AcrR family transcriptional regulator